MAVRCSFQSTSSKGLRSTHPAMRLWRKAKKLGVWDPADVEFSQDRVDWRRLNEQERDAIFRLTSLFQAGEEAVTLDLLPLIEVIAMEGRLEEEMYLTSFLFEEAKHVDAFRRFLDEVCQADFDLSSYHTPSYRRIFHEELPSALGRLRTDRSPVALAEASVTYNLVVEGILAETGYHGYYTALERNGIMPGMQRIVAHLKRDESRHIAYGVFLLSRLVAEHGDEVWNAIEQRINALLDPALAMIVESLGVYEPCPPFGISIEEFSQFAVTQFQLRLARVSKARGQSLAEVLEQEIEEETPDDLQSAFRVAAIN